MATKFTVSQAEFQLEAGFTQAEFSLFRDTNNLLDHLFKALQPYGARLADIRVETGGGSAADFNVVCYLFNYWVTLRVRIDRIEMVGSQMPQDYVHKYGAAIVDALLTVRNYHQNLKYRAYTLNVGMHGGLESGSVKKYISNFVKNVPDGLGPTAGNGIIMYFGPVGERLLCSVIIDRSTIVPDGLFVAHTSYGMQRKWKSNSFLNWQIVLSERPSVRWGWNYHLRDLIMDIQLNNNVFDQLTVDRDHTQQTAGLAAMMAHSSEQSFGLSWPEHRQGANGERTKNAALAHSSIDLVVESAGTPMGSCLAVQCKAWPLAGKHRAEQKKPSPALGLVAEHIEITYRVALSLMEREQITLARKALDALPVGQLGDPIITRLRKMLAVPVTKTSEKRDIDRALDYQWIRDHAQDYRGQWVALDNGELLGAGTSLRELLDRVKPLRSEHRPLLHQIS